MSGAALPWERAMDTTHLSGGSGGVTVVKLSDKVIALKTFDNQAVHQCFALEITKLLNRGSSYTASESAFFDAEKYERIQARVEVRELNLATFITMHYHAAPRYRDYLSPNYSQHIKQNGRSI